VEVDQAVDVKDPTYKTKAAAAHALAFARLKLLAPDAQKTSDLYYTMNGFTAEVPLSQLKNVLPWKAKVLLRPLPWQGAT